MSSLQPLNTGSNKQVFQADQPKSIPAKEPAKGESLAYTAGHSLFSLIFFPYGIYRLAKAGCKKLADYVAYPTPGAAHSNRKKRKEFREKLIKEHRGEEVSAKTPDGHKINGTLCRGTKKKVVIYCIGRGEYFESGQVFNRIHNITEQVDDINLLLFNPRGVGENEGTSSAEGAALDLYSWFQYLVKEEKIDPNDIVIYGHSLGGAYGTLGAGLIQQEYPDAKINLLSDRSFCDYEETIQQVASKLLKSIKLLETHPEIREKIEKIVHQIIGGLVNFSGWKVQVRQGKEEEILTVEKALKSLKGRVCLVYNKEDEQVSPSCSVYKQVQKKCADEQLPGKPIRCIKLFEPKENVSNRPHSRYFSSSEEIEIVDELKAMFNLPHQGHVNLRRVKDVGPKGVGPLGLSELPKLSQEKGPAREFDIALHAATRLYDYLDSTPEENVDIMTRRLKTILSSVEMETGRLLSDRFLEQKKALENGKEPPSVQDNPQETKEFYLNVLKGVQEALLEEADRSGIKVNEDIKFEAGYVGQEARLQEASLLVAQEKLLWKQVMEVHQEKRKTRPLLKMISEIGKSPFYPKVNEDIKPGSVEREARLQEARLLMAQEKLLWELAATAQDENRTEDGRLLAEMARAIRNSPFHPKKDLLKTSSGKADHHVRTTRSRLSTMTFEKPIRT